MALVLGYDAMVTDPGPAYVQTAEDFEREQRQRIVQEQLQAAITEALKAVAKVESLRVSFEDLGMSFGGRFEVGDAYEYYLNEVGGAGDALARCQVEFV